MFVTQVCTEWMQILNYTKKDFIDFIKSFSNLQIKAPVYNNKDRNLCLCLFDCVRVCSTDS